MMYSICIEKAPMCAELPMHVLYGPYITGQLLAIWYDFDS